MAPTLTAWGPSCMLERICRLLASVALLPQFQKPNPCGAGAGILPEEDQPKCQEPFWALIEEMLLQLLTGRD